MIRALGALIAVLFLSGCGAAAGIATRLAIDEATRRTQQPTRPSWPAPVIDQRVKQAPIYPVDQRTFGFEGWMIGTGIASLAPDENDVTSAIVHGEVIGQHTRRGANPGIRQAIEGFLEEVEGERFFSSPPVVRIGNHGPVFRDLVMTTIQLMNSALPNDFQIQVDANPYSRTSHEAPPRGEIHVELAHRYDWPGTVPGDWVGVRFEYENQSARIYLDTAFAQRATGEDRIRVLAHEFLHAMGMGGHLDLDPGELAPELQRELSLIVPNLHSHPGVQGSTILFPLDLWGLRAMYDPESLGDWNSPAPIVFGCMPIESAICFGASKRMGDASPWAFGTPSFIALADNPRLSGSATWRGRLLGLTPSAHTVGGAAVLTVDLDNLDGVLGFTGLEYWHAGRAPGRIGSGFTWGDGDLHYGVQVIGSNFVQDGRGDAGLVTGGFSGTWHQAMAGVLERDDLAAGFGGKR